MNGEVQLIVNNIGPANVASMSNDPILMGIGALSRFVVTSSPEIAALPLAQPITIYNAAGDSVTKTLNSIVVDSPVPGQTRLNLAGTWSDDYSAAAGGYIIVQTGTQYYLDLFENESISQNWKFQDLSNFTAQGAFSREFRIPMSDNNIKAIGPLFDTNSEQGAENYFFYKLPAEIRVDTLPIATGYLRVRKVYKQMNRINEVEVAFYAETPDLVRTIGEKKLSDIAALADLNEVVNYANVTTETADRVWALCDRGQLWSNSGGTGSRPILNPNVPIFPADLTPAISWWFLLRNIVTEAGFELVASSLENIIEDYYMPFCNTAQLNYEDTSNQFFFAAYPPTNVNVPYGAWTGNPTMTNLTEVFDNSSAFNSTLGYYTAPAGGQFTFFLNVTFQTTGGGALVAYTAIEPRYYIVSGANVTNMAMDSFFYSVNPATGTGTGTLNTSIELTVLPGDIVYFEFTFVNYESDGITVATYNPAIVTQIVAGNGSNTASIIGVNSATVTYNGTIDYRLNAPDMRQIDFVNDVIKMHNCAIVPSRIVPNRIAIVPQNNYLGTGDVVDWTSKLDISKDVTISSTVDLQKAKFQFTYTAGEDVYSKLYKDNNRVYGDYQEEGYTVNPSTSPSDFAIGEQKVTLVTRSTPAAFIPGTGTPIPCFYNEQLEFNAPGPRALFYAGAVTINLYNETIPSAIPTTIVPILNHYSDAYPVLTDYDLNWAPEVPPHFSTVTANPYNNLFNTYWRNYMNELYSPEGRMMEAFFALDLKDILTFSFADKIWIQDSYWRILEISDYKVGLQESTKVKLIKFLDQINDCSIQPTIVSANGEVYFQDGEGNPAPANEDCCSRYGYFWDEINGVCWAFNNGGQFRNSLVANTSGQRPNPFVQALSNIPNAIINGSRLAIEGGNSSMLMVGQDLSLTKDVSGSNLLGRNVVTNLPGLHVGGGYRDGNSANAELGWAQSGVVMLHYKDAWVNSQIYNLLIEGIANEFIELPNDTLWSCLMNATIIDTNTGNYCIGQYSFGLQVTGGTANATAITTINEINNTAYTFTYDVDTTTNTDQHRVNLQVTGLGATSITFVVTASIHYQQNKLL
jgi:hypothetical protein